MYLAYGTQNDAVDTGIECRFGYRRAVVGTLYRRDVDDDDEGAEELVARQEVRMFMNAAYYKFEVQPAAVGAYRCGGDGVIVAAVVS